MSRLAVLQHRQAVSGKNPETAKIVIKRKHHQWLPPKLSS